MLGAPRIPHVVVAVRSRVKWIVAGTEGISKSGSIYALGVYGGGDEVTQSLISKWEMNRDQLRRSGSSELSAYSLLIPTSQSP